MMNGLIGLGAGCIILVALKFFSLLFEEDEIVYVGSLIILLGGLLITAGIYGGS